MSDLQSKIASPEELTRWARESRAQTLALVAALTPEQLLGRRVTTVNPMIWHLGHISWFQERWVLRHLNGRPPLRGGADLLYDSFEVAHETRWELELPSREGTLAYMSEVMEQVLERIATCEPDEAGTYFNRLGVYHEDMHAEAMAFDAQTLDFPAPPPLKEPPTGPEQQAGPLPGDVEVAGLKGFLLGGTPDMPFVFDNEKWAHPVDVADFSIARAPVTNGEFAQFVEAGGYGKPELWSLGGKLWLRNSGGARHPVYWRAAAGGGWESRRYEQWTPIREHNPVMQVNWYEAEAFCEWAGRRLPSEAEWEVAAATEHGAGGSSPGEKRLYPWGGESPQARHANLDSRARGPVDVGALAEGDSFHGCRQMVGNVWEWTASPFYPFPGFVVDPYREYSAPWFGYRKVLKGGSWATPGRMMRNSWRNFFLPDRRDIFAGFRTCAR